MILNPGEVCTHSYLVIGGFNTIEEAKSLYSYLSTKFVRFLVLQVVSGIDLSKNRFDFVPLQKWSRKYEDIELYKKYELDNDEIDYIENVIRPME